MAERLTIDTRTAAEAILQARACGRPRCACALSVRRGHGKTHCPIHEDNTPSFGVDSKNGKLLVYCYTGACKQDEITDWCKAHGWWPEHAKVGQEILATYDYVDELGNFLYQTVRYVPKAFKQRRPKPNVGPRADEWEWNLDGCRRVLYHLPDLLAADPDKTVVFLVEGEKDVDRLRAEGLLATTNIGGANKWLGHPQYVDVLRDRFVVAIQDNDEPGRQHVEAQTRSLIDVARQVQWLELPELDEHGDISDWLMTHGVDELKERARAAPLARERLKTTQPARPMIFESAGLGWRYVPSEAKVELTFSRVADARDATEAEVRVSRLDSNLLIARRRFNLLAGRGGFLDLARDLHEEADEIDERTWRNILRDGCELVLDHHRNGIVVELVEGNIQAPPPVAWLCEGLLLKNRANCWLAAASTGKSTLAKAFCAYHAAGYRFLNRPTERGNSLYLDWEDDKDSFMRVIHDVCRNLGVWPIPPHYWIDMHGRRFRDQVESLTRIILEKHIDFVVIDAIAAAGGSTGEHMSWEAVALEMEHAIGQLPPVTLLALDHVTSEEHKQGERARVPLKGRGAERKVEFIRNQWSLMLDYGEQAAGRHVIEWTHTKINGGLKESQPFTTEVLHRQGELAINVCGIEASPEALERLPMLDRYIRSLVQTPGQTTRELCAEVRGDPSTRSSLESTRTELLRAQKRGRVYQDGDGKWYVPLSADNLADNPADSADSAYSGPRLVQNWPAIDPADNLADNPADSADSAAADCLQAVCSKDEWRSGSDLPF